MPEVIQNKFKFIAITLLILLISGVVIILNNPINSKALENGDNAIDIFGQFYDGSVDYASSDDNNGLTEAGLSSPSDVVLDEMNHLMYVADAGNNRVLVYELEVDNSLSDLYADYVLGQSSFRVNEYGSVDATVVQQPVGLALDVSATSNRLFVSEKYNNRVLVFDFYNGDPLPSPGYTRSADYVIGQTDFYSYYGGTSASTLNYPAGLDYDRTNNLLYVVDQNNNRVMIYDGNAIATGMSATYVLGGTTSFSSTGTYSCDQYSLDMPWDVDVDENLGLVYVSDTNKKRVLVYDYSQGGDKSLQSPASTTSGIEAHFVLMQPDLSTCNSYSYINISLGSDNSGRVYVGDPTNGYLYIYDMNSYTVGIEETAFDYIQYDWPSGITYNQTQNQIFYTEASNHRGLIIDATRLDGTFGVTYGASYGQRAGGFGRVDPDGYFSEMPGSANNSPNDIGFASATSITYDEDENWLIVGDMDNRRVMVYDRDESGAYYYHADYVIGQDSLFGASNFGVPLIDNFNSVGGTAIGEISGVKYLFVADQSLYRVLVFNLSDGLDRVSEDAAYVLGQSDFNSSAYSISQSGLGQPVDVAFDDTNDILYIVDAAGYRVLVHDFGVSGLQDGRMADYVLGQSDFVSSTYGCPNAINFCQPLGVEIDEENQRLFVVDQNRIMVFDVSAGITNGMAATNVLGASTLTDYPGVGPGSNTFYTATSGISYNNNKLYVSDPWQNRVLIFDVETITDGMSASYVLGQTDFTGTGYDTTQSTLHGPTALEHSAEDDYLYVSDFESNRIMVFYTSLGPAAPSACSIDSYTNSTATMSWTDNSSDEDSFTIEKSTDQTTWTTAGTANSNVTTGTATSLSGGQTYYFRVKAVNSLGDSQPTTCGSVTLPSNNAPTTPAVNNPSGGATDIPLAGQTFSVAVSDPEDDQMYLRFELSTDENFLTTLKAWDQRDSMEGWPAAYYEASMSYIDFTIPDNFPLTPNTTYYWRFRAFDVYGAASDYSDDSPGVEGGSWMYFTTVGTSAEEDDNTPFVSNLNGDSYSLSSTVNVGNKTNKLTIPADINFSSGSAAFGSGMSYDVELFDADGDSDLDVIVNNEVGPSAYVYINDGSGSFTQGSAISNTYSYGIADFDYDGDLDIATHSAIYNNNGSGDFTSFTTYNSNGGGGVKVGDFNNDGYVDIFVYAVWSGYNAIYLNDGSGSFTEDIPSFFSSLPATYVVDSAAVGDLNGDGYLDIAFLSRNESGTLPSYVLLNDGDLDFTSSELFATAGTMQETQAVDIDSDGDLDLLIGQLGVFLNDGTASFTAKSLDYQDGCETTYNYGDIDGDGDLDLVCAQTNAYNNTNGQSLLFRNLGRGNFASAEAIGAGGTNTGMLALGDLDGDGDVDMIEVNGGVGWNQTAEQNYIYFNAEANYLAEHSLGEGYVGAVFDADNDGDMDQWYVNGDLGRYLKTYNGNGEYTMTEISSTVTGVSYATLTVDIDNDGDLDVIEAISGTNANQLWINDGSGGFTSSQAFGSAVGTYMDAVAADVNLDGYVDIMFSSGQESTGGELELWLNDGDTTFSEVTEPFGSGNVTSYDFDAGDIDNDGDIDVILEIDAENVLFLNDGSGNFSDSGEVFSKSSELVQLGDMDNDGWLDVVVGGKYVYLNNGGSIADDPIEVDSNLDDVTGGVARLFDLDNDGDLDIFLGREGSEMGGVHNLLYRNYGNLSFVRERDYFAEDSTRYVTFGDVDMDGDVDIFVKNAEYDDANYWYEPVQSHSTQVSYAVISGVLDNTTDNIYKATLTADINNHLSYTIAPIPLSYDGVDYDVYTGLQDGGIIVMFDDSGENSGLDDIYSITVSDQDVTELLARLGHVNFDLALMSVVMGEATLKETVLVPENLFPSQEAILDYLEALVFVDSAEIVLYEEDVFVYDSSTREYTYVAPIGVTPINTLQSGDPSIDRISSDGDITFFLTAGESSGGDFEWSDVDTSSVTFTDNINAYEISDLGSPEGYMNLVVGDNGLAYYKTDLVDWISIEDLIGEEFPVGVTNFNDLSIVGDGLVLVGDNGYMVQVGDSIEQICHVGGVPIFNENLNAISSDQVAVGDDYSYVVGDGGTIIRLDFTEGGVVCSDERLVTVTDNLNDVETEYSSTDGLQVYIGGDNGALVIADGGSLVNVSSLIGLTENINAVNFDSANDDLLVVGDNGLIVGFDSSGEPEIIELGISENLNELYSANDFVFFVGESGAFYYVDEQDVVDSSYVGSISNINSILIDDDGQIIIAGDGGLFKTSSMPGDVEYVWEEVEEGVEYTFSNPASSLRWRAVMQTDTQYESSVLYNVSVSYSTAAPSGTGPTSNPPTQPSAERPDVLSSTSIQWNFSDTSNNETGFRFYDESGVLLEELAEQDLEYVVETGLEPNTRHQRQVSAYNGDGESGLEDLGYIYTLANVPSVANIVRTGNDSISITINEEENSNETKYAIYEVGTQSWVKSDKTLGSVRAFKTYSDWLAGGTGIELDNLTEGAMYCFKVLAENGDGVRTELSDDECLIVSEITGPNIVLTKSVGVNIEEEVVGVYFGRPVFAGTEVAEKLRVIPLMANLANVYIAFTCFLMVLCLFLVLLNAAPCCRPMKHAHKLVFTDWRGKKCDDFYHLLHGEDAIRNGKKYNLHRRFYKFTNWGTVGVFLGIIIKVGVVLATAIIVYGSFQVHAFENESGQDVYPGDELTYQITFTNNGDETATDIIVTDTIPNGVTYIDGSLMNGDGCSYFSGEISCFYEEMEGGAENVVEFKARVDVSAVGETIINVAYGEFAEGDDIVSSNSVSNEVITDEEPVDCPAGETCSVELSAGWNLFKLAVGAKVSFPHVGGTHAVQLTSSNTTTNRIGLTITSDPINVDLAAGAESQVDSDGNGMNDMVVKAQAINSNQEAVVGIMAIEEVPVAPVCGDNACNGDETCETCPGDCGVCPPVPVCGDKKCNGAETCNTCPGDCGVCPVPPVCGDKKCNGAENCSSCPGDCGACVVPPVDDGQPDVGGAKTECSDTIDNDGDGLIDLNDPGCSNPNDQDEADPVVKPEDDKKAEEKKIKEEKLNQEVEQILQTETTSKVVNTISTIVSGITKKDINAVKEDVKKQVQKVVVTTKKAANATIDNPAVEKANEAVQAPVVSAATAASVASVATVGFTGATGATILTYLQFLFTQPLMLITRRRRRGWGVIYNSITKKPIDLAIVRLYSADTKKLVQTRVTDRLGRYQFIVKPGMYYLEVDKKEFNFPSNLLNNVERDGDFNNVYYGSLVKVGEEGTIVLPIPIDPNKKMQSDKQVMRQYLWKKVQGLLTLFGPIMAIISFIITPETWIAALIVIQIVIYIVFKRLAESEKPISWGMVKDALSGKSLKRSIVRVFDTKFNKLLDTQVTDNRGKYAFLVGNDQYYITSEKEGYEPHKTPAYDMSKEGTGYLARDIHMVKEGQQTSDQDGGSAVAVRSKLGRQAESMEEGKQKVVRPRDEKFSGEIPEVDLKDMHEDYYDVDVLRKD